MLEKIKRFHKNQKGITGLETAIILIAFVVVASVFAYTVLSAGIFSSEKGKEAVHSGLEEARGSMETRGSVVAYDNADIYNNGGTAVVVDAGDGVTKMTFSVSTALSGEPVDLTPPYTLDGNGALADSTLDHLMLIA